MSIQTSPVVLSAAFIAGFQAQENGRVWALDVGDYKLISTAEFVKHLAYDAASPYAPKSGKSVTSNAIARTIQVQSIPYESELVIPKFDWERNYVQGFTAQLQNMGNNARLAWNNSVCLAMTDTTTLTFDGQPLYSANHVSGSYSYNNAPTASQISSYTIADTSSNYNVLATEMANILVDSVTYMQGFQDASGNPVNQDAAKWLLTTANPLIAGAAKIVGVSDRLTGGQMNPFYGLSMELEVVRDRRLGADTDGVFWLSRKDSIIKPFLLQEEYAPELRFDYLPKDKTYLAAVTGTRNYAPYNAFATLKGTLTHS